MDAIEGMKKEIDLYERIQNDDPAVYDAHDARFALEAARTYAAIAQAEQLQRIADALEAANGRDGLAESVRIYGAG